MSIRTSFACIALLVCGTAAQAQSAPAKLTLSMDGKPVATLDRAALDAMPQSDTTAGAHEQPASHWRGVAVAALVTRAGAPYGHDLRGKALARYVRVTASDGYQVVFSLGELDPGTGNETVLLADSQDDKPIGKDGPLRLVVPNDKRPARWVRNVMEIDVVDGAKP